MEALLLLVNNLEMQVLGGIGASLIALILGHNPAKPSLRMLLTEVILAVLLSAFVVETWLMDSSLFTCCLVGFAIGFVTDDIYENIVATIPHFIRDVIGDVLIGIRLKIKRFFGIR